MEELKGPPDYAHWMVCWLVFQSGMIMAGACVPPWLIAYSEMIGEYVAMYGSEAWALLFQCDTRFRREHLPRMLRTASRQLNNRIARGNTQPLINEAKSRV